MTVTSALQQLGGIAQTPDLLRRGCTHHDIRKAFAAGSVTRPRRGWVALPSADPQLVFAARHNVTLTCISQAGRLGLWVLKRSQTHVAGSLTARKTTAPDCTVHWRQPLVPRRPGLLADGIENTLDAVAACLPFEEALTVWDSALQKKLIDYPSLAALPLGPRSRALLEECTPFSDSGVETLFRTRLRWVKVSLRSQVWLDGHRVDFLLGERLVIQVDGKQHTGTQRSVDMVHDAELAQRGYTVFRVSYAQVVYEWPEVEERILGAIARGLHLPRR